MSRYIAAFWFGLAFAYLFPTTPDAPWGAAGSIVGSLIFGLLFLIVPWIAAHWKIVPR